MYELKTVKCLLYGEDILEAVQFHYADLISECLKLCFTLMHRLNKSYLTEAPESFLRQAKKFARYACEFAMIFKGFKNPFIGLSSDVFLKHYPELKKHGMLIGKLWDDKEMVEPADSYDFIVDAAHLLLSRYLKLVRSEIAIKNIEYGKDEPSIEAWFSFPSKEERNLFAKIYESTPDYRKIREAAFVGIETRR